MAQSWISSILLLGLLFCFTHASHLSVCDQTYEMGKRLQASRNTVVYEGSDRKTQEPVMIKFLTPHSTQDKSFAENTVSALKELSGHPNMIKTHCIDTKSKPGVVIIVMERCETHVTQVQSLTEFEKLASDLRDALVELREHKMSHTNIDPSHLLKCKTGGRLTSFKLSGLGYAVRIPHKCTKPYANCGITSKEMRSLGETLEKITEPSIQERYPIVKATIRALQRPKYRVWYKKQMTLVEFSEVVDSMLDRESSKIPYLGKYDHIHNLEGRSLHACSHGQYTLKRRRGKQGAQGVVYNALDAQNEPVIVKLMKPTTFLEKKFTRQELAISRELQSHPNIVDVYCADDYTYPDIRVLVMEMCEGELEPLSSPAKEYRHLLSDLRDGLVHMSAHHIIHLDIKPANVLKCKSSDRKRQFRYKYADFGLAQHTSDKSDMCVGTRRGTPRFMAPELKKDCLLSPKADVYALGVTLWDVLGYTYVEQNHDIRSLIYSSTAESYEKRLTVEEFSTSIDNLLR